MSINVDLIPLPPLRLAERGIPLSGLGRQVASPCLLYNVGMSLLLSLEPAEIALPPFAGPQVAYALVRLAADAGGGSAPVSWAVVADASRSMRIPIVSEEQFRQLVRAGSAQEVLVDGVPVWQLAGPVPEDVRASAPSALDYTARALHSIVERLDRADRFALIACAEEALALVPATGGDRRSELSAGIARLRSLRLGEATDLAAGLRLALAELTHAGGPDTVRRIILLTDGFTRDTEACLEQGRVAAARGIAVSTLGLGSEFQDDLLTRLADIGGGRAVFLRRPEEIPAAVAAELDAVRGTVARALTLSLTLPEGATLRRATRLSSALAPIEPVGDDPRRPSLHLGDLARGDEVRVLLELIAPPVPPRAPASGARRRLAELNAASGAVSAHADLILHYRPGAPPPPPAILAAAGRAGVAQLQRRAAEAAARGDQAGAAAALRAVAARLSELGQSELAAAALREAAAIEATGRSGGAEAKAFTYATRRLGEHELPDGAS